MSAILSVDDLNDFISPGVACIKPIETLPRQRPTNPSSQNLYEVTTEDQVAEVDSGTASTAQISLTDCLACSGCVTSAEAVLVSLQSHEEVLRTLDAYPSILPEDRDSVDGKIFVASVSPQTRASLAATYGVSERAAGHMIEQLLSGPEGLRLSGKRRNGFTWVVDTNVIRELCHALCVEEAAEALAGQKDATAIVKRQPQHERPKVPVLSSACPGWVCYAEKTHPHVLAYISRVKSPQALTGTLFKSVLSRKFGVSPDRVWHLAVMPCFDKKLEASREELTDAYWAAGAEEKRGVRDVDCVITARELIMLAELRGISFPTLPRTSLRSRYPVPFPDPSLDSFLFPRGRRRGNASQVDGPSGGYAYHVLSSLQKQYPGSEVQTQRGRNVDVVEYILLNEDGVIAKTARYYGFRNIQNLIRRLKPQKTSRMRGSKLYQQAGRSSAGQGSSGDMTEYAYVEVMACPGGCTNGGGQIKVHDVAELRNMPGEGSQRLGPAESKAWLVRVDEAYYSADSSSEDDGEEEEQQQQQQQEKDDVHITDDGRQTILNQSEVNSSTASIMAHWTALTGIDLNRLVYTSYRQVNSSVGKSEGNDMERVAGLASSLGGGW